MKIQNLILYIGIAIFMYLSTTVAAKIGIGLVGTYSSFLIVLLFVQKMIVLDFNLLSLRFRNEFIILLVGIFIILFKYVTGDTSAMKQVLFFILIPMFLSILLQTQNGFTKNKVRNLVLIFFLTECSLAIYERIFGLNVFPYVEELSDSISVKDWEFRSTAFLGHPLMNALVVSTIMGFVLTTTMDLMKKLFYLLIGFTALLCFNARGATLAWSALAIIYMFYILINSRKMKISPTLIAVFSIVSISLVVYLMTNYGFGGRLIHSEIIDGSAQTRLDVFQAFSFINNTDFWLGNSANYLYVMEKLGAGGVENSFVVIILSYGIVMFVLLFVTYYFWLKGLLKRYGLFHKFLILFSFLVVGSMNNALAGAMSWGFFILCVHTFPFKSRDSVKQLLFKQKLIIKKDRNTL